MMPKIRVQMKDAFSSCCEREGRRVWKVFSD